MNIALIGMPAAGKSTIGVLLAKALGWSFLDTDLLLQEKEQCLLQQIIDKHGSKYFLDRENELVADLKVTHQVIATGGSLVYSPPAIKHLKEIGTLCYLELDLATITRRLQNIQSRGVIMNKGQRLEDLYRERAPLYAACADFTISCQGKNMEQIVTAILARLVTEGI
jgi:shikimate kinase